MRPESRTGTFITSCFCDQSPLTKLYSNQTQALTDRVCGLVTLVLQTQAVFAKEFQPEENLENNKLSSYHPQSISFEPSAWRIPSIDGGRIQRDLNWCRHAGF